MKPSFNCKFAPLESRLKLSKRPMSIIFPVQTSALTRTSDLNTHRLIHAGIYHVSNTKAAPVASLSFRIMTQNAHPVNWKMA